MRARALDAALPGVAVCGAGYWGKNLIRIFHRLGALRAICDSDPACLARYEELHPGVTLKRACSDVLQDPGVQAVAIASPAETHYALTKEVLLAGKDVLVEKPLCFEATQAAELIALAEANKRVLMVGHVLRYHPAFVKLQQLVAGGELGRIYYMYSNRLNLGRIRQEENILWSFAPHDISAILALAGDMPRTVLARGGNYLRDQTADVTLSVLEFASGLRAHVFVSWLHPYKEQRLVVVGDKKMAVFNDVAPAEEKLLLYPHQIHWRNHVPTANKVEATPVEVKHSEPLLLECQHFLECVRTRATPLTDGEEGHRVLRVLNACQRSLDHGESVTLDAALSTKFYAHSTAVIEGPCEIGDGTKIWHFSHVMRGARVGRNCVLGQNVQIGPDVTIGNNVKIQNNVSVYTGVILEDDVFCGPSMVFTNVVNPRSHISRKHEYRTTLVRKGASIGANTTIVCGVTLGRYAFVGAGAVVTQDVPDHTLVYGNPARVQGWVCQCGVKLHFVLSNGQERATCESCGIRYAKWGEIVEPMKAEESAHFDQ